MFKLKHLTPAGIERALGKVERYRFLGEPWEAESICRDVLEADPDNRKAITFLLLAITDQFGDWGPASVEDARALLPRMPDAYERAYYAGMICEKKGTATLRRDITGTGPVVHQWLSEAMMHYEEAEELRPPGNDDAIVRWNTCARLIMLHEHVRPDQGLEQEPLLE